MLNVLRWWWPREWPAARLWVGVVAAALMGWMGLAALEAWWTGIDGMAAWGYSLQILAFPLAVGAAILSGGGARLRRVAKVWLDFSIPATVGMLAVDLHVRAVTGRSVWFYLWLVLSQDAGRWTGSGGMGGDALLALPPAATLVAAVLLMRGLMCVGRRGVRRSAAAAWGVAGMSLVYGAVMAGAAGVGYWEGGSASGSADDRAVAWAVERGLIQGGRGAGGDTATKVASPEVAAPEAFERGEGEARDVWVVVVESWRADALREDVMPGVWAWSRRGRVMGQHFTGGNCSFLGVYSLLHGRGAAEHRRVVDAGVQPRLLDELERRGYERVWIGSSEHAGYERMDEVVRRPWFDAVEIAAAGLTWPEADVWTLGRAVELLGEGHAKRRPRLVVTFLMSTHFAYPCPEAEATREATPTWALLWPRSPSGNRGVVARYQNAAGALDRRMSAALAEVDLTKTSVLITGDHGQSLFDDGTLGHWTRLSDAQLRVPCVMLGAGVMPGRSEWPTSHADVADWLLTAAGGGEVSEALPREDRPLLLVQTNPGWGSGWDDLVLIDRGERLGLRRRVSDGRVEVTGLLDRRGRLSPNAAPLDVHRWATAARAVR